MTSAGEMSKKRLVKELQTLPVYRFHRHNLRPWDRPLPVLVANEADNQDIWEIEPPSASLIFGMMIVSLIAYQLMWLLPIYVNYTHINSIYKNIDLPAILYDQPKVWLSLWIVSHLSSGMALWFVWLTGGFLKHAPELVPIGLAFLGECVWIDLFCYVGRLDLLLLDWIVILASTVIAMQILWKKRIAIATIFFGPQAALSLVMVVYSAAFVNLDGSTYMWVQDRPRPVQ